MVTSKPLPPVLDIQVRMHGLLYSPQANFLPHLALLESQLTEHLSANSDHVLITLVSHASTELHQRSSTHAMLVMALSHLGGLQISAWDDAMRKTARLAALTMNISMMELQDRLSQQAHPLSDEQKAEIGSHPVRSEEKVRRLGCNDSLWLEVVRRHHEAEPGMFSGREPVSQIARLIQRADVFASRISPRKTRSALSAAAAAQATYLGEDQNPDEAGAALIKAVGIYPPGCWAGLTNGELAVALKRSEKAHCPMVAAFVGPDGIPLIMPQLRDTSDPAYGVSVSLAPGKIKYRPPVNTLLRML